MALTYVLITLIVYYMHAYDVILMPKTETGLQNCISKLGKYCDDWCLEVNFDKSKVIVFNKAGKFYETKFTYRDPKLESVREYRYLGATFAISRSFSHVSSELYKKGLKGFFKLKSIFGTSFPNINLALHIFDHTIKPILTYGSEN